MTEHESAQGDRRRFRRGVKGLRPLSELPDFEVAAGEADVRGWIVTANDGHAIGTVRDLLADPNSLRVRQLVVELGPEGTLAGEGRLVVIPLSEVDPDPELDVLIATTVDPDDVELLHEYDRRELDGDDEAGLLRRIGVRAMVENNERASERATRTPVPPAPADSPASDHPEQGD